MPVFFMLVILGLVLFWFLCVFLYKPIGKLAYRLWNDFRKTVNPKDEEKEETNKEKN